MHPNRMLRSSKSFNLGHTSIIKEEDEHSMNGDAHVHAKLPNIVVTSKSTISEAQKNIANNRTIRRMRSYTLGSSSSSNWGNNGNRRSSLSSSQLPRRASMNSFQSLVDLYLERENFTNSSSASSSFYSFDDSSSNSSSNSSSSNSSPSSSPPCSDSEELVPDYTPLPALSDRVRRKLSKRDRNNELDFLLKRKSLQLSRQSSLGSGEPGTPLKIMSRNNSIIGLGAIPGVPGGDPSSPAITPTTLIRSTVKRLATNLRSDCDKILDLTQPFIIDAIDLWRASEGINIVLTNNPNSPPEDENDDFEYNALFLSDFFEHSPSLCISSGSDTIPGNLDLTYFRSLQYLELRKIPPHMVAGLNTIRNKLRKLKLSRCIDGLAEIFTVPFVSAEILSSPYPNHIISPPNLITSIWRELKEIDVSFNRIETLETKPLECSPCVEILNCSRNQIRYIEPQFARLLNSLTVLNLNYNQLKVLPPLPPTLKVLLLSNNYISSLGAKGNYNGFSAKNLESLDLSQNILSDESELEVLASLSHLKSLEFKGNPLSYSDKYREIVCGNLHRLVLLNKNFTLDGRKLSNAEVKVALDWIKTRRPRPMVLLPNYQSVSSSTAKTSQLGVGSNSLTQSFDSSRSSSLINRKKAKIREIVILDSDDVESSDPVERQRSASVSSKSKTSRNSGTGRVDLTLAIHEKLAAYEQLREKYGEDNWLLRQGGVEVSRKLYPDKVVGIGGIPITPGNESHSKDPVGNSLSSMTHYYSALQDLEGGNSTSKFGLKVKDHENESSEDSGDSIKPASGGSGADHEDEEGEDIFYACHNTSASYTNDDERFIEKEPVQKYRTFQNGIIHHLIVLDHFLYEVDPTEDNLILNKWDLKGFKSIIEGKRSSETETTEFTLQFETLRKSGREKTFIMPLGDYSGFESQLTPFLQIKALQEFADGYQCVKCNSQFSKGQALSKVVIKSGGRGSGGGPREIPICPIDDCGSEILVTLDSIPLPNNESLQLEKAVGEVTNKRSSFWDPIRTSTPLSGFFGARSLPTTNLMPKNTTTGSGSGTSNSNAQSPPSSIGSASSKPSSSNSSIHPVVQIPSTKTKLKRTTNINNNNNNHNQKSDSDIETLSRHSGEGDAEDSSSIEVVGQGGSNGATGGSSSVASSSSDGGVVVVEEGLEVDLPVLSGSGGPGGIGLRMTDSTSSAGTGSSSICTQYENLQPISFQMQSSLTSISTSSSQTTLTGNSSKNLSLLAPTVPIKYDYEDFHKVDHRLQLYVDLNIFKHQDEKLLLLTKVMLIGSSGPVLAVVVFSNKKVYLFKVIAAESDNPDTWLQKITNFPLNKLTKLDVLIGRHGVGLEFPGKYNYYALLFRDSTRTSNFIEYFLSEVCGEMENPCLVQDFSQSQKLLMSPTSPIAYFGVLRYAFCGGETGDKTYAIAAIVLTNDELIIVGDLAWLVNRAAQTVNVKHVRTLGTLRQVESLEVDPTFIRLVYELSSEVMLKWELLFETESEKLSFLNYLQSSEGTPSSVPFISLSQPLEI